MISINNHNSGFSLVEMLLVLAAAAAILLLSVRQYQIYRTDADLQLAQYNANILFHAASNYYQATCNTLQGVCGGVGTCAVPITTLVPYYAPAGNVKGPSFVKSYSVQFTSDNTSATQWDVGTNKATVSAGGSYLIWSTGSIQTGSVIIWRIQVVAQMTNPKTAPNYVGPLNATCSSTFNSSIGPTGVVNSCTSGSPPGPYVVWERLPSFAMPMAPSDLWITNKSVQDFNSMYTSYPRSYLLQLNKSGSQYLECSY